MSHVSEEVGGEMILRRVGFITIMTTVTLFVQPALSFAQTTVVNDDGLTFSAPQK